MRKKSGKIELTDENIKKITKMVSDKKYLTEIAEEFDVVRDTVKKFLIDNNIDLPSSVANKKYDFSNEQIEFVQDVLFEGLPIRQIANLLNVDRSVITRVIKENNLSKQKDPNKVCLLNPGEYRRFLKLKMNEGNNLEKSNALFRERLQPLLNRARTLSIKNKSQKFDLPDQKDIDYILNNHLNKNVHQMMEDLKYSEDKVRYLCGFLGVKVYASTRKIEEPKTSEFREDISNPSLSNAYLGKKYKVSSSVIKRWRTEKFGTFKTMVDTWRNKSVSEIEFEEILEEIDMVAEYQKNILGWKIDFYLGFKVIVEVNSSYHHNAIESVKEKDRRKIKELEDAGYKVLVIWDYELKDKESIKIMIKDKFYGSLLEVIQEKLN